MTPRAYVGGVFRNDSAAPLAVFIISTLGGLWAFTFPLQLAAAGAIALGPVVAGLLGVLGLLTTPALTAVWVAGVFAGRAGLRDLWRRLTWWRAGGVWYVVAIALPFGLALAALAIASIVAPPVAWLTPPASLLSVVTAPLLEEIGWRGFALPRLLHGFSPLSASLILGPVWAVWHLPFFFVPGSPQSTLSFPLFALEIVGATMVYTWLFCRTGGSLPVAILFHAAANLAFNMVPVYPTRAGSLLPMIALTGLYLGLGLALLLQDRTAGRG